VHGVVLIVPKLYFYQCLHQTVLVTVTVFIPTSFCIKQLLSSLTGGLISEYWTLLFRGSAADGATLAFSCYCVQN